MILMGPTGSGKTHSVRTLVDAGIETFVVFTEPHGRGVVSDIPCPKLHWTYVPPSTGSWTEMIQKADVATKMSWKALSGMTEDPNKSKYTGFFRLLSALHNFRCDRCGKEFGDVSTWGTNRALAIDSWSGINEMAMQMFTGESIARSQPQWGAAMNTELSFANKLCYDLRAHFVLICHLEYDKDEVLGGMKLMPLSLGRKVAPDLPKNFSDVILAQRLGTTFSWSTANPSADLKAINVPISDKLPSSFVPVIEQWKTRGGIIEDSKP